MLREIFRPVKEELKGDYRRLHNEKHRDLYSSAISRGVIKSRRKRWKEHVEHTGLWSRNQGNESIWEPKGRREDILKWILKT